MQAKTFAGFVLLLLCSLSAWADDEFPFVAVQPIIVNVGETPGYYARVELQLEVREKGDMAEVAEKMAIVRDRLIVSLAGRPVDALRDVSKRYELREELVKAVNEGLVRFIGHAPVKDVLFTDFMVGG